VNRSTPIRAILLTTVLHKSCNRHVSNGFVCRRARTQPVLDNEWLAHPLGKPLANPTRNDVVSTAGGKPTSRRTGREG
jgi:hypothetical protein